MLDMLFKHIFKMLLGFSFAFVLHGAVIVCATTQRSGGHEFDLSETPIDVIKFIGNKRFTSTELADAISSRASDRSITREIFLFYYRNFYRNPYCPPPITERFRNIVISFPDGLRYFSESVAHDDKHIIEELYNQHGYHEASVEYAFNNDSLNKKHILTFIIDEGKPYYVRSIVFTGLQDLPSEIWKQVKAEMKTDSNIVFEESRVLLQANAIENILQNNGWYFSTFQNEKPLVYTDTLSNTDSVAINFTPGKRIKIGEISVARQLNEQSVITDDLIWAVSELHEGDWYSRKNVLTTINALYQLGVYDFISIDTIGRKPTLDSNSDVCNLQIFTRYKEQGEFNLSPFLNHTANDNLTNFGVEASIAHRNVFGAAQNLNLFARYIWNDFQFNLPQGFSSVSSEIQGGVSLSQPILWFWRNWRISGNAQTIYSRRFVIPHVAVNTFSAKVSLPIVLPPWVYFTSILPEFSGEVQSVDHGERLPSTEVLGSDQVGVIEPLRILYKFTGNTFRLTGVTTGINLASDNRNDLFNPSKGHLLSFNPEIAFGPLALYKKIQTTYLQFEPAGVQSVFAAKIRLGHIFADSGNYIPVERLFYAGGANSVRSYGARLLFDPYATKSLPDSIKHPENIGILIGSKSLIEGSFEYRFSFARPSLVNSFIASQIERMGVTFFLDYGSTYNSSSASPNLAEILANIAVGFGVGFRYSTPVGPFRLDVATRLYDPTSVDRTFITQRNPIDDMQLHIGLGHAF